jgi:hypothetical protein
MLSEYKRVSEIVIACVGGAPSASRPDQPSAVKRDLQWLSTEDPRQVTTVTKALQLRLPLSYATAGPSPVVERKPHRGPSQWLLPSGRKLNGKT